MSKQNIIVAVTGGIAAYKSCELVRLLTKSSADVKVIMTASAQEFIHPNTFAALSNNAVHTDIFSDPMLHIELAKWADKIIIAPATAATISRIATGLAEDLLTTVCLATEAKCLIAPAMNKIMWQNPATVANIKQLQDFGYNIIMPAHGEQACGDVGYGRMAEPQTIAQQLFASQQILKNINVTVTAGPTQERIDSARYLSNYSSGKMGYALAQACVELGANVTLISGPTALTAPNNCNTVQVQSAEQMHVAVQQHITQTNIFISAAAVADYTPTESCDHKIKKSAETLNLKLNPTIDILKSIKHYERVFKIGFAAESENLVDNATRKLKSKQLDAIIANQIESDGFPFAADDNAVIYINKSLQRTEFGRDSKATLAHKLMQIIAEEYIAFTSYSHKPGIYSAGRCKL